MQISQKLYITKEDLENKNSFDLQPFIQLNIDKIKLAIEHQTWLQLPDLLLLELKKKIDKEIKRRKL